MPPSPKDITNAYSDFKDAWRECYADGDTDVLYLLNDPWDSADKDARRSAGRPCLSLDELNQYLNQYVNNLRQQKLGVKVTPKGNGANDDDAKRRENLIRGVEDESNA